MIRAWSTPITQAFASSSTDRQQARELFSRMCRDIGLSEEVGNEVATLKQEVMIEEYRRGHRQPAELLHRFDDLRKRIGFPEPINAAIMEDEDDGTNNSGYYASRSRSHGAELDASVRGYLENAGIWVLSISEER